MPGWTGAGDPRFFSRNGPLTLAQIAQAAAAVITAEPCLLLSGVAPLQVAGPADVSFWTIAATPTRCGPPAPGR